MRKANKAYKLLLVDDERHLLVTLGDALSGRGFSVVTANSAELALKTIERVETDLILLDISMPGMGGLGFLRRIATAEGGVEYPVIVLTARAEMESFFEGLNVEGFACKPCNVDDLTKMINKALALKSRKSDKGDSRTLLLAEDDMIHAEAIVRAAQRDGWGTDLVTTGPAAVERCLEIYPDVVVVKQMLPGMNGSSVAALLRSMPTASEIPLVLYDETDSPLPDWQSLEDKHTHRHVASADPFEVVSAVRALAAC